MKYYFSLITLLLISIPSFGRYCYRITNKTDDLVSAEVFSNSSHCLNAPLYAIRPGETKTNEISGSYGTFYAKNCCGEKITLWAPEFTSQREKQQKITHEITDCEKNHDFEIHSIPAGSNRKQFVIVQTT